MHNDCKFISIVFLEDTDLRTIVQWCTLYSKSSNHTRKILGPETKYISYYLTLTINVPVVFMARYVMIFRGATSLRGVKGWALKIETFLGPEMA